MNDRSVGFKFVGRVAAFANRFATPIAVSAALFASTGVGAGVKGARAAEAEPCAFLREELDQARAFYERRQYLMSALKTSSLWRSRCSDALRGDAKRIGALAYLELGERDEAEFVLRDLETTETGEQLGRLRFVRAYALELESDLLPDHDRSRLRLWRFRDDLSAFSRELAAWPPKDADPGALDRLHREYLAQNRKSPVLAGVASALIPGAGQAYNGAWQSAGLSLVLNSIFLWATLEFADRDLIGPAVAAGTVFSVTYVGNILSAVEGAHAVNRQSRASVERELKRQLLPELSVSIPF